MNTERKYDMAISMLEADLKEYDLIYLSDLSAEEEASLLDVLPDMAGKTALQKRVLILSSSAEDGGRGNLTVRRITTTERDAFLELYDTYEFSDRFQALSGSDRSAYGNLWNYIRTGLLDVKDAAAAVLWTAL